MLSFKFFLRNLSEATVPNKGSRSLKISILIPEVDKALKDWISANKGKKFVLIGGIAFSHHAIPRSTQDIDVLYLEPIPENVNKFKRIRPHSFQHNKTHVEVETLTPSFIKMNPALARQIYDTAVIVEGVRIANPSGIIASKLQRFSRQDAADIENLIRHHEIDISKFTLTKKQVADFTMILNDVNKEKK